MIKWEDPECHLNCSSQIFKVWHHHSTPKMTNSTPEAVLHLDLWGTKGNKSSPEVLPSHNGEQGAAENPWGSSQKASWSTITLPTRKSLLLYIHFCHYPIWPQPLNSTKLLIKVINNHHTSKSNGYFSKVILFNLLAVFSSFSTHVPSPSASVSLRLGFPPTSLATPSPYPLLPLFYPNFNTYLSQRVVLRSSSHSKLGITNSSAKGERQAT